MNPRDRSKKPLHSVAAMALSVGLHGVVLGVVVVGQRNTPPTYDLAATKLGGQTFDVDALGDPSDEEVSLASGPQVHPPSPPDVTEDEVTPEPLPAADPAETDADTTTPLPVEDDAGAEITSIADAKSLSEVPPSTKPAVDPFDLGQLPGETTNAEALPGEGDSDTQPVTGAYGAEGVESSVVDVYATLLRQLPLAAKADPVWTQLPEGDAGRIEFTITVNDKGQIGPVHIVEDEQYPAPAHLKRAVPLAVRFFKHARVRLNAEGKPGSQRLALVATVHRRPADPKTPNAAGVSAFGLKGEQRPTGVYFTYFSGHHIEIQMWRLP